MNPPPPAEAPVEVAAGLVFREGKLLITRRSAGGHLGGLWEFPGGKREPGETFEQCLHRELREELGIEVQSSPSSRTFSTTIRTAPFASNSSTAAGCVTNPNRFCATVWPGLQPPSLPITPSLPLTPAFSKNCVFRPNSGARPNFDEARAFQFPPCHQDLVTGSFRPLRYLDCVNDGGIRQPPVNLRI